MAPTRAALHHGTHPLAYCFGQTAVFGSAVGINAGRTREFFGVPSRSAQVGSTSSAWSLSATGRDRARRWLSEYSALNGRLVRLTAGRNGGWDAPYVALGVDGGADFS